MRKGVWMWAVPVLMTVLVPWILLVLLADKKTQHLESTVESTESKHAEITEQTQIRVYMQGQMQTMSMSDYLVGVLISEIPGTFHYEAKKAQAVVARTYALRVSEQGYKHGKGVVCTDASCCQGYSDPQVFASQETVAQARAAVAETSGEVLTYEEHLIDATYFSCSGGRTESAVAVWGQDVPYLRSVESPGEESALYYTDLKRLDANTVCSLLGLRPQGHPSGWIGAVTYTEGGGVQMIYICGKGFSGTDIRTALNLRSTAFSVVCDDNDFVFTTKGYGHRVGMSQFGADAMAQGGKDYKTILCHYYPGVRLAVWKAEAV